MVALPATDKVSNPDQFARNKLVLQNGTAPTNGAPLELQISTSTPTNMPTTGKLSVWATSAGLQTSADGTTIVPVGGVIVTVPVAATSVDNTAFIANRAYTLAGVRYVNTVIASSGPTTLDIKKCVTTDAPSAGTTMLTATIDLTTTANTVLTPALTATGANLALAAGNRIGFDFNGTMTSVVGMAELLLIPA